MKLKVHTQILIAIVLGIVAGILLGEKAAHIKIVGDMFIRLLKAIIIPLILASMVAGIVSLGDVRKLGRIGLRTFIYYMATTTLAVGVGLILVNLMKPGIGVDIGAETAVDLSGGEVPSVFSIISDIIPANLFEAMAKDKVLSVIFFSLLLGVAISSIGEKGRPLVNLFEAFNSVMMKITDWIMRLAPYGVFALMAHTIGSMGLSVIKPLIVYMATVFIGLAIHAGITLPVLLIIIGKYSPLKFIRDVFGAVATAFSTASSAATLPITMDCLQKNTGVSNKVTSFVLPLGATVNMDGTALYEAVAAMFIAQAYGIDLSIGQQLIIMLTATLASIGAAAIPGAGLVTMVIVLRAVNLPLEGIGMILAVDRILDMLRTAVNVWGDACGAAVVANLEGEKLIQIDQEHYSTDSSTYELRKSPITVLEALFTYRGRMSRSDYWLKGFLPLLPVGIFNIILAFGVDNDGALVLSMLIGLVSIWPGTALIVKRLHDRNQSGWFVLTLLIPFINIIFALWITIEVGFLKGTTGSNRFGNDPLSLIESQKGTGINDPSVNASES